MPPHDEQQTEELAAAMPQIMGLLGLVRDADGVPTLTRITARNLYDRLDHWCWHHVPCAPGAACLYRGEPR